MKRPPLWLAGAAVASGWAALYTLASWVWLWHLRPIHEDVRMDYVAAEAGLRYGWSTIYDRDVLRALSGAFPPDAQVIDVQKTFASPPLVAWLFAPLTTFTEPEAYLIWSTISLCGLVFAWCLATPYAGLARLTVLLATIGLWPVLLTLFYGQPTLLLVALVAAAWRLCSKGRAVEGGVALAVATFLKPQAVLLLPAAVLVSGRLRPLLGWVAGSAILGAATIFYLGGSGLAAWWSAARSIQSLPVNTDYTLAHVLGFGPLTYAAWTIQGAAAMFVAWRRRAELEIVFAAGILGTAATASYYHQADYSVLALAAWLVLRSAPPIWHRVWIGLGIVPMQLMIYGPGTVQPALNLAFHLPQLVWDATWLAILAVSALPVLRPAGARAVISESREWI